MSDTFDRDALRDVLNEHYGIHSDGEYKIVLRALQGCLRPAPQQRINRDALVALLKEYAAWSPQRVIEAADRILALQAAS